ncbi:hypothetical protein HPB47_001505 [Ixodes persulcatus]|uniref:Uncharacterized protein n=1 Tax=Ixodes persulcatus TaxID=34615 RepID=A0AC60PNT3_IXOPE|nr:hypothetical protein HPB47_001505 [Ixodes persulcatus]
MSKKKPGIQNLLYQELLGSDPVEYRRLLRVNSNHFADILSSIASCIQKLDTKLRPAIPAIDKLQLTLRSHASAGFCTLLSAHPGLMEMEAFGGRQHCETPSRTQQPDCRSLDLDRSVSHPSSQRVCCTTIFEQHLCFLKRRGRTTRQKEHFTSGYEVPKGAPG